MMSRPASRKLSLLIIALLIALSLVFPASLLLPEPAMAQGGTFPDSPFNGMQITYSIAGATVTDTKDSGGFTTSRTLKGTLGTGQLTISGSAKMGNGYDADVTATVACGDKTDKFTTNIKSGFPGFNEESFSISVPISKGATSGSFSINMTGHYNAGNRGLVVSGTFEGSSGSSVPSSTQTSTTTQTEQDPPPGPLTEKLPDVDLTKKGLCFIEKVEGNPIYISADSPSLPPSQRKWVKIMPGEYSKTVKDAIFIDAHWTVRTPSGAETVMRSQTGALWRQKERSWFETQERVIPHTPASVVLGRLLHGIAYFYCPRGEAGAKKYEVALNRAIVGIKGTSFVVEVTETTDTIKLIEGSVELTHNDTGNMETLEAGYQVTATESGFGSVSSFDVDAEKSKWGSFYQDLESNNTSATESLGKKFPFSISSIKCPLKSAYQSEDNRQLALFREFRDCVLLTSAPGKVLVDAYYRYGPVIAVALNENELLRLIIRGSIIEPVACVLEQSRLLW